MVLVLIVTDTSSEKKFGGINANTKKGKRTVQGVPQLQTAAHPRHREEEETKQTSANRTKRTKSTKTSSLFPKRAKRTEKHKNKITQGKT